MPPSHLFILVFGFPTYSYLGLCIPLSKTLNLISLGVNFINVHELKSVGSWCYFNIPIFYYLDLLMYGFVLGQIEKSKQDDALSDLSNVIGELKNMAVDMGTEFDRWLLLYDTQQNLLIWCKCLLFSLIALSLIVNTYLTTSASWL